MGKIIEFSDDKKLKENIKNLKKLWQNYSLKETIFIM